MQYLGYIIGGVVGLIFLFFILIPLLQKNKYALTEAKFEEALKNIDLMLRKKASILKDAKEIIEEHDHNAVDVLNHVNNLALDSMSKIELNDLLTKSNDEYLEITLDNHHLEDVEDIEQINKELKSTNLTLEASIKFYNNSIKDYDELRKKYPTNITKLFFHYKKKDPYTFRKSEALTILQKKEEK